MNFLTLHFKENKIEELYNEKYWQKQSKLTIMIISLYVLSWSSFIVLTIISPPQGINLITILTDIFISLSIFLTLILSIKYPKKIDIFTSLFMIVFSTGISIILKV